LEFRRGSEKSVAVAFAVNGSQGSGGKVDPPDSTTVDRCAQTYVIQALDGPRW
jgi:hypothetical protein